MNKIRIFTAVMILTAAVVLAGPAAVLAQYNYGATYTPSYTTSAYSTVPMACINLTSNLYVGVRDTTTGGQVSALQSFLISQGYLTIVAPTGYFGVLTSRAVAAYQRNNELPSDGTVGVLTRASIKAVSCGNNYNNSYNNYNGAPVIISLSASTAAVGTSVTIYGSGFDLFNNTVNVDGVTLAGIPSYQGIALAFTVPQVYDQYNNNNYNYNYGYNNTGYNNAGTYSVSVMTSRGTSNSLPFTVTSSNNNCYVYGYNNLYPYNNCYNNGSISISNVTGPTNLTAGSQGNWSLTLYNPNSNYVSVSARWGDENTYGYGYASAQAPQSSYVQGQQTVTFTHTYQTSGYYTVVFTATDNNGAQTSTSATVNVSGSTYNQGQPYLSSISPNSGPVGTQVVLYGSGFTPTGNVVHFGNGGTSNVSASNGGNTIYYTIPHSIGPCDVVSGYSTVCPMYLQQVTPGSYPIYVSNTYGQTSTMYFTVTY